MNQWTSLAHTITVSLCQHFGWFPVNGGTAVQCQRCLMVVTDDEVRAFARHHRVMSDDVRPGTVLAKQLHAPWAGL